MQTQLTKVMTNEEMSAQIKKLEAQNEQLLKALRDVKAENEQVLKALGDARVTIRRAKDPRPVERPSLKRTLSLVADACMTLSRIIGGWQLTMGHLTRRFRSLQEIWKLLTREDWFLSEIFPPVPPPAQKPRLPLRHPPILVPRVAFPKFPRPIPAPG